MQQLRGDRSDAVAARRTARSSLRQRFVDDAASATAAGKKPQAPSTTYGLGRWSWDEIAAETVLRGAGPERRLVVRDAEHIELRVASPIEHVLVRDAGAAAVRAIASRSKARAP